MALAWGTLSDRFGARPAVLLGSVVLAASLASASQATSLLQFQLIFGLMVGGSTAAIFAPVMACAAGWFDTHRSLAVSLVSASMGMAPMTVSPLAAWLVSTYDWRPSLQIIAALAAAVMIPAALLVRRPPALECESTVAVPSEEPHSGMSVAQAVRSP
jgi:MFS family permease